MKQTLIKKYINTGYTTEQEALAILDTIDKLKTDYPIVEIGVWEGRTTAMMAEYCQLKGLENKIIGIDTFGAFDYNGETKLAPDESISYKNIQPFSNASFIKGYSNDKNIINKINKISLLFIDGNHSYDAVIEDIENWLPKVKEFCLFHDYNTIASVKRALDDKNIKPNKIVGSIAICLV